MVISHIMIFLYIISWNALRCPFPIAISCERMLKKNPVPADRAVCRKTIGCHDRQKASAWPQELAFRAFHHRSALPLMSSGMVRIENSVDTITVSTAYG